MTDFTPEALNAVNVIKAGMAPLKCAVDDSHPPFIYVDVVGSQYALNFNIDPDGTYDYDLDFTSDGVANLPKLRTLLEALEAFCAAD